VEVVRGQVVDPTDVGQRDPDHGDPSVLQDENSQYWSSIIIGRR
jgi:hypothetical protein